MGAFERPRSNPWHEAGERRRPGLRGLGSAARTTNRHRIVALAFDGRPRNFDVELWDGSTLPRPWSGAVAGRVVLRTPRGVAAFVAPVPERRAVEAFLGGDVDIVGDTVGVLDALADWEGPRLQPRAIPLVLSLWMSGALGPSGSRRRARGRHSIPRDARAVQHHYDLSDDFFRLFLDERMVYSCAYFPRGGESIEQAQEAKLALTCRKLDLRPGDRLLDVGCGWGGLLTYAATTFGAIATGTTVSRNQFHEARRSAIASHVADRVQVLERDYRALPEDRFDKIVSVGMMEHVGADRLDDYFAQMFHRVRPGGLFLNHAIADIDRGTRTMHWLYRLSGSFIDQDIFPDSELPPIGAVLSAAERQGFEVRDVESLREHYAQTLRHWVTRLEERFDEAMDIVGTRKARAWRLYLASSAVAFTRGRLGVYQTLLARRTDRGEAPAVPRSRGDWYGGSTVSASLPPVTQA